MSLTSTLNAAVTGLQVNQKGLEIASHNIGNVNTEGYSRRVIHQEAADTAGLGARGVNISQIERVADEFLTSQIRTESATLGRSAVRDRYFTNIQGMFGDIGSDSSIGQRIADMTTRIESLAIDPESPTAASGLIEEAQGFTRDLNTIADEILRLRSEADLEIEHAIAGINDDLQLIADLNDKIATRGAVAGADVGDMLDQRDQALKRVGELINIKTFQRSNGEMVVFTGDARALVDGDATQLTYNSATAVGLGVTFDSISRSDGLSIQSDIRDGELKGLLEMRDKVLPNLHAQLDVLAASVRDLANAVHNRGMGLPAAPTLTGSRTFADPATDQVTVGSDVRFAVADAAGVAVATFDLPAGVYTISDLAAAIDAGLGAEGSAVVDGDGRLVVSAADPANGVGVVDLNGGADAAISFDDGSGAKAFSGFSNFFGLNDLFQTPGVVQGDASTGVAGTIEVRADLITNPERLSRGRMTMSATPPVVGADRVVALGDGTMMQELGAAFSAARSVPAVGGLPPINKPLHEYAAEIVGLVSQLAADEQERLAFEQSLVEQLETRLADKSGVNLDEELAKILVLQNAFSASARVVTTADEMMEVIIGLKR